MILTNYPEHQQAAIAEGAEPGFGKLQYAEPTSSRETIEVSRQKGNMSLP